MTATPQTNISSSGSTSLWRRILADPEYGRLPAILLGLTAVTGIVDAVSILALGRVFVANMTGNIVFIGFALAGAPGFSLVASLAALCGFLLGAFAAGRLIVRSDRSRESLLLRGLASELTLLVVALGVSLSLATSPGGWRVNLIAAVMAIAMGVQNTVARRLAVPDLTTTVLTLTLTGLVADVRGRASPGSGWRRLAAVLMMLCGAVVGAELVLHTNIATALALVVLILAILTGATTMGRPRAVG
jgi:uncharacterized membrane protein YoaK (UPF0700 family)